MNMRNIVLGVIVVAVIAVVGFFGYVYISGGSGEASEPIAAPALSLDETPGDDMASDDASMDADSDSDADTESEDDMVSESDMSENAPSDNVTAMTTEDAPANDASTEADRRLYRISQDESEVRFTIDELLFGDPKTVIGATNEVAGDIIIDFADPTNSEVGTIVINARTLSTDNDFRNRAIRSQILQSAEDAFEFITFTPTAVAGLPSAGEIGTDYSFEVTGDLQIRDITSPVTFTVSVVVVSDGRIEGSAETTVLREDFNLQIPDVPNVSNVAEEVPLFLDFVALEVME